MRSAKSALDTSTIPVPAASSEQLLEVDDLSVVVAIDGREYPVLENVSFTVGNGKALGLVGESGSGKSLTLRAIMGLLPPNARVSGGEIRFRGENILANGGKLQRRLRGVGISMVFQEPAVALNPIARVGQQISDGVAQHRGLTRRQAREYAIHMMELVGIPEPHKRVDAYPSQLSGGMRQRVMIAASVASEPALILCDEPTTALDVTVQAQILSLFAHLRDELDAGLLYVTHDLTVVAQLCDDLAVLYAGKVVETGEIHETLTAPKHAYTQALLRATPRIDGPVERLQSIPGTTPSLVDRPPGYSFEVRMAEVAAAEAAGRVAS
jgi:peptide/nickel transport system ATP-binding protein